MAFMLDPTTEGNGLRQLIELFGRVIAARLPGNSDFQARERAALELGNELVREDLRCQLQAMADAQPSSVTIDGVVYRRHHEGRVDYHSLCGPLSVQRWSYRVAGVHNGRVCVPLEKQAGLMHRGTPEFCYCLAQGYAKAPVRSVEQDMRAAHRWPPSRSTMERMATEIGTAARRVTLRIEQRLRNDELLPDNAVAINLGLDRTTIPMAEDRPAGDGPRDQPERRKGSTVGGAKRRNSPSRVVRYRMGYVGTVAITNKDGETLEARRYSAAAHAGPSSVLARMMADLRHARAQNPKLMIGVVQDGAPEMWNRMRDALRAELNVPGWGIEWHETIDRYHLMEHLSAGLELLEKSQERRERRLEQWCEQLDQNDFAIEKISDWFQKTACKQGDRVWVQMQKLVGGYIGVSRLFRYATAKRLGLHEGSGVTEGACKSLITSRTKRSGQRWRPRGISAVLALRSLLNSDRLDKFWPIFAQSYTATCAAA
jgi:hypothetical protein